MCTFYTVKIGTILYIPKKINYTLIKDFDLATKKRLPSTALTTFTNKLML